MRRLFKRKSAKSPWHEILASGLPKRAEVPDGTRVLCASSVGGAYLVRTVDSVVALALWLRGAEPTMLLCDGMLPACEACVYDAFPDPAEFARNGPQRRLCSPCFSAGADFYAPLPVPVHRYSQYVDAGEMAAAQAFASTLSVAECFSFEQDGLRLGEQARAGTIRFFGKAQLHDEPPDLVTAAARRYAAGAIVAAAVARRVLAKLQPDCLVAHHGVYVPQGVLGEVARQAGVRVVNWGVSYRNTTIIASHEDTYHRTLIDEPTDLWDFPLTAEQVREISSYLETRRRGRGDWTWVTPEAALRPEFQADEELVEGLGLDPARPIFGLLTNVLWDAQLYYEGHAFADMLEWLFATLDYFLDNPELQLIVRIHPHEIKSGNRQPVAAEIERRYGRLPPSIAVVPYDHSYNTYALMGLCRAVLIYGTKTGVELVPYGTPVIVSGDAWIRGKGLTMDISCLTQYEDTLERLTTIEPLDDEHRARGLRYAYHYFLRRMIPLAALDPDAPLPALRIESAEELLPGRDPGLDVMCEGILRGAPFVFDRAPAAAPTR